MEKSQLKQRSERAARFLARKGIPVFPFFVERKIPATRQGLKDATTDEGQIIDWFRKPGLIPAIVTGVASGIDVLDLDLIKHAEANEWFEANQGRIPQTVRYKTRSGGLHLWFKHSPGLKNSVSRPVPGVDVRAEGGCAIFWPAVVQTSIKAPIVDWPRWLLDAIKPPQTIVQAAQEPGAGKGGAYFEAALRRAVEAMVRAGNGSRNATLNREAFSLARFIKDGSLSANDVVYALVRAAQIAGLPEREIAATIKSAFRARGMS
jgi:hypothetical protein